MAKHQITISQKLFGCCYATEETQTPRTQIYRVSECFAQEQEREDSSISFEEALWTWIVRFLTPRARLERGTRHPEIQESSLNHLKFRN